MKIFFDFCILGYRQLWNPGKVSEDISLIQAIIILKNSDEIIYINGHVSETEDLREIFSQDFLLSRTEQGEVIKDYSEAAEEDLRMKRAKAVRKYLINKGVSPKKLIAVPYSDKKPLKTGKVSFHLKF
ncbi:OmpA family protein [Desulfococcaceae bacterium HSG8]|nr:OmpA family protein [Desulfococcaceae bacterium HSG8]